jgi:glycosyltransferase involved in cell wall biosynthesis
MARTQTRRRTRVLYLDQTASLSGGELALLSLIRQLDKQAYEPTVILFEAGPLEEKLKGLAEVLVLPLDSSVQDMRKDAVGGKTSMGLSTVVATLRYIARLIRTIRRLRPDVIHANSLKADIIGGVAARLLGVPLIWHIRDRIADDYLPHRVVLVFRKLCRIVPNYVIANSQSTLETLYLPATKPSSVIPSGFDVAAFAEAGRNVPALPEAIAQGSKIEIGIVGRISPWKGQDIFLQAAALVHAAFPQTHFSIIGAALFGEHEHERKLRELATELKLDSVVTFHGFQENVIGAIGNLDILVHASIIPEPLGQVIAQGLAAGKPVVASRGGGASEIVDDGVTGTLVAPGDVQGLAEAILEVLTHPDKAERMAQAGQTFVSDSFDPRMIAERVEVIYDRLRK